MNPTTASMPTPRTVNDVAPTAPVPQPSTPAAPQPSSGPSIISNIPVHMAQTAPVPAAANEDAELDKIMHDVGQELKKEDKKTQSHGLLGFLHHEAKPLVKVNNPVVNQAAAATAPTLPQPALAAPVAPAPASPMPQPQPTAANVQARPKNQRHVPVFVIFVALCVTGFLVAAAIAAYRPT